MDAMHFLKQVSDHVVVPIVSAAAALSIAWPFQQIAIPAAVLFMAFLGAGIWVFLDQPNGSRLRVYGMVICYALLSAAAAVFVVYLFKLDRGVTPPLALLIASGGRPFYTAFRKGTVERIRKTTQGDP